MENPSESDLGMTDYTRLSRQDIVSRRQTLRRQRRVQLIQKLWRTLAISSLALGAVTVAASPRWHVQAADQIEISGNQLLTDEALYEMLPIDYPQPLLKIRPQSVEQALTTQGPIADAVVSRRLFPPGLNIRIIERHPVAIAMPNTDQPISSLNEIMPFSQMGLLDESGYWMPYNSFTRLNQNFTPPTLQIQGMREAYQVHWATLYKALQESPIDVLGLDWRDPTNLVLQTELGQVHVGPYRSNFSEQLATLDQMRYLNAQMNIEKIAFIDLRNPEKPNVQILQATHTP